MLRGYRKLLALYLSLFALCVACYFGAGTEAYVAIGGLFASFVSANAVVHRSRK